MARARRETPPKPPNGFVASAARLPAVRPREGGAPQGWQHQAWQAYDATAELRYIANWRASVMSRARLVAARRHENEYEILTTGPAFEAVEAYYGGPQGHEQMLHATGLHHTLAGECFHVHLDTTDEYLTLPFDAVTQHQKRITATIDSRRVPLGPNDLSIRIWNPHPRNAILADSPTRSNLTTIQQIHSLNAHIIAQLDSRLNGSGILFLPSEIQFASDPEGDPQDNQADAFMAVLGRTMAAAMRDHGSAAAKVPIVVTAPGESLDKVQWKTFWSELDEAAIAMLDSAIRRLAIGMDSPPEVLLGVAESNHWNAWVVDEAAIKAHIEPALGLIDHALTTAYLQPALVGLVPDPENYEVLADTSLIRLRPNRSNEAMELYDRGELSGVALRRETGFDGGDVPSNDEFIRWLLRKVATGSTSPEQTVAALAELGADIRNTLPGGPGDRNAPPGDDMRTDTRRKVRDTRAPDMPRAVAEKQQRDEAITAACEALVLHALTRVGNKLTTSTTRQHGITDHPSTHRHVAASGNPDWLLEGAWELAPQVLDGIHPEPAEIVASLDMYVRGLIEAKQPHTREAMVAHMMSPV